MYLHGNLITHNSPRRARALGIGIVYQQPALFPDLTVAENIAFATKVNRPGQRVNWKVETDLAKSLAGAGRSSFPSGKALRALSQPLNSNWWRLPKPVDAKPSVLILDEPTATLGEQDAENLFRVVRELQAQGTTVVYITHRFEEIFRLADRVTVLRDGECVETCAVRELTRNSLVNKMVGREVSAVFPNAGTTGPGNVALEVRHLACKRNGVKDDFAYGCIVERSSVLRDWLDPDARSSPSAFSD